MISQSDKILDYLQSGGKLTVLSALELFGCYALSQRIGGLKAAGHNIDSHTIKLPNGKSVSEYFIKK